MLKSKNKVFWFISICGIILGILLIATYIYSVWTIMTKYALVQNLYVLLYPPFILPIFGLSYIILGFLITKSKNPKTIKLAVSLDLVLIAIFIIYFFYIQSTIPYG